MEIIPTTVLHNWNQYNLLVRRANLVFSQLDLEERARFEDIRRKIFAQRETYNNREYILQLIKDGCVDKDFIQLNRELQTKWKTARNYVDDQSIFNPNDDSRAIHGDIDERCWLNLLRIYYKPEGDIGDTYLNALDTSALKHTNTPSLEATPKAESIGLFREIGLYEITKVRQLVAGTYANIFAGVFEETPVAVKIYKDLGQKRMVKGASLLFENEINTLSRVSSEFIVPVIGRSSIPRVIVTKLMWRSLFECISKNDPVPPNKRLPIALRVAKGLQVLHSKQILFTDFTSTKVLFDENFDNCKLTGLSCCVPFEYNSPLLKKNEEMTQTIENYMAPEVRLGGKVSVKSNVYSLGLILREIFTGEKCGIFTWKSIKPLAIEEHLSSLVESCCKVNPDQRPGLADVIRVLEVELLPPMIESLKM